VASKGTRCASRLIDQTSSRLATGHIPPFLAKTMRLAQARVSCLVVVAAARPAYHWRDIIRVIVQDTLQAADVPIERSVVPPILRRVRNVVSGGEDFSACSSSRNDSRGTADPTCANESSSFSGRARTMSASRVVSAPEISRWRLIQVARGVERRHPQGLGILGIFGVHGFESPSQSEPACDEHLVLEASAHERPAVAEDDGLSRPQSFNRSVFVMGS